MKAVIQADVRACDPPTLAVQVDDYTVSIAGPHAMGQLSRVDVVAREVRFVGGGEQTSIVAVYGIPAMAPVPPAVIHNLSVKQEPIAWVTVGPAQWEVRQEHIHVEWPPPHGCEEADVGDEPSAEALVTEVVREELAHLWYDLHEAVRSALNGRWSIQCDYIQGRIEKLTKLVGPTPWESIQIGLIETGVYQKINRDLGFDIQPDMARVAEVRARSSTHPFQQGDTP